MPMRPVLLPPGVTGTLWLASMPGRLEPWPAFVAESRERRLALVLCLTPDDEVRALSPDYWKAIRGGALPFTWRSLPVRNFDTPSNLADFIDGIETASQALQRGDAVMLHCAAGIGRTGTAAACLLKQLGLATDEALRRVRNAGSNPETARQGGLVERFGVRADG